MNIKKAIGYFPNSLFLFVSTNSILMIKHFIFTFSNCSNNPKTGYFAVVY
jgi:hypothetical protein